MTNRGCRYTLVAQASGDLKPLAPFRPFKTSPANCTSINLEGPNEGGFMVKNFRLTGLLAAALLLLAPAAWLFYS